jgi:hypothetical protein
MKIYNDETIKEEDLPEGITWNTIVDRPYSLSDLNIRDGQRLDNLDIFSDQDATAVPTGLAVEESGITTGEDGTISAYVVLTWNENTEDNFDNYSIRYKRSDFAYYNYISTKETTITIEGLLPNKEYNFGIASINKYGIRSAFSSDIDYTTATSTTPPATVQNVSALGGIQYVIIEWDSNTEADLASYNIYRNTVDNSGTATKIASVRTNYFVNGNLIGGTEYFYWVKAVNTSGLESTSFSTVASATPRNVASSDNQIGNIGWTQDCVFSSTNETTVSWTAGTFSTSALVDYNISSGNTGVMGARTYIYLDIEASTTEYQTTTTAADSVGDNKCLIAVAENNTGGAILQVFGGAGGVFLSGSDIVAGSVTADQIAANTITAGNIQAGTITATEIDTSSITSLENLILSAENILIDGATYLSNWRKTGDVTKIDGGEISTNTITTTQLNFTPVQDSDVIAKINASSEGISITADRITINGKSYFTSETGARVEIFPDDNTGLLVKDDADNDVFKTIIGGTHVGDVYIGDYSNSQGMFYDKSANKFYFRGDINAGDISAGTINAARISGLTDSNIDSINFSNITVSGTITGALIRTAASGRRVQLETSGTYANHLSFYNTAGNQAMIMGENFILAGNGTILYGDYNYSFEWSPMADYAQIFFSRNIANNSGPADPVISGNPGIRFINVTRIEGVSGLLHIDGDMRIYGNLRVGAITNVESFMNALAVVVVDHETRITALEST